MPEAHLLREFSARLIAWQKQHGRHTLPWQNTRDPYAIWVSEIMLQQTQVGTVIPYYQRFMQRFPDIATLASADEDAVLAHWSGLGYYSRARNLHAAAQQMVDLHGGRFPSDIEAIVALPGIGRSTAAAIAAFAFGHHGAILDGNVKRVLARCFGIEGWPGLPSVEKQLWALAEDLLPATDIEAYIQGLMDLGATLCVRSKPDCDHCPLNIECVAHATGRVAQLPTPKPKKSVPQRETVMLVMMDGNDILLQKRPPSGIWGGLWSLPEMAAEDDAQQLAFREFGLQVELLPRMPSLAHAFTHFRLQIRPQPLRVVGRNQQARESGYIWLNVEDAMGAALPTPVRKLLRQLLDPAPVDAR